jgi:3-oxosteroid 1-dehydrogenase
VSESTITTDEHFDVIVVGSGGGLVGAYIAASRGLRTVMIEKTEFVGGTTAYSGAGIWLPGNAAERRGAGDVSAAEARSYLDAIVGDDAPVSLRESYLDAGVRLIDELEQNPRFQWFNWYGVPDYIADAPGSNPVGHTIFPAEIAVSELGELASLVRRPIWTDYWGTDPGEVMSGGRALIGRALLAFIETGNGEVRTNTALTGLLVEDGAVVGIEAKTDGTTVRIGADRGVILAAGGFERNRDLRNKFQPDVITDEWTQGCPGNTGAALQAGIDVGAATALLDESWFVPGLVVPESRPIFWTSSWSGIYVNSAGERFMNENLPYDQAGHTMLRLHTTTGVSHIPAHWVFDQRQVEGHAWQLPVGDVPSWFDADTWVEAGVLTKADTLAELAELIGVPAGALEKSVEEFNGYARDGVDKEFHRGETPWDRYIVTGVGAFAGLPAHEYGPNPCLAPVDKPPYYAATLVVSDLGTKGGLQTDDHGRVIRPDGSVIKGLYAAGNTMAAMSGRVYPGAGVPIGSSITFSYLAALDMAAE